MTTLQDTRNQLAGYRLTTAEIYYRHPDYPDLINPHSFVWQDFDLFPSFPELRKFLAFWQKSLDGKLHSIRIMHARLITPAELRSITSEHWLN